MRRSEHIAISACASSVPGAQPYLVLLPGTENEVVVEHSLIVGNHNVLGCSVYARHSTNHNVDPGAQ